MIEDKVRPIEVPVVPQNSDVNAGGMDISRTAQSQHLDSDSASGGTADSASGTGASLSDSHSTKADGGAGGGTAGAAGGSAAGGSASASGYEHVPERFVKAEPYAAVFGVLEDDLARRKAEEYTPEQWQKLRKRYAARRVMASVGDIGSAIANMVGVHHYAPNMYDHNRDSLGEKVSRRWEKLKADREQRHKDMLATALQLANTKNADLDRGLNIWQYNQKVDRDKADHILKAAAAERDAALKDIEMRVKLGELDKTAAEAEVARIKAKYAEEQQKAELALKGARVKQANAAAANSYSQMDNDYYYSVDEDGNIVGKFKKKDARDDYDRIKGFGSEVPETSTQSYEQDKGMVKTTVKGGHKPNPVKSPSKPKQSTPSKSNDPFKGMSWD